MMSKHLEDKTEIVGTQPKWIFFDVGGVLLNDDPVMAAVFRHIWESVRAKNIDLSFENLLRLREKISNRGPKLRIHHEVALEFLNPEQWRQTRSRYLDETLPRLQYYCPPMPDVADMIFHLEGKVNLGLIANQPEEIIPVLEKLGYWEPFKVRGISDTVGIKKPEEALYQWALDLAGCHPHEAVMVGDTVKYDIKPARAAGMKTVWFNPSVSRKGFQPRDEFEAAYLESLKRQQFARRKRVTEEVRPDATAYSGVELHDILKNLAGIE